MYKRQAQHSYSAPVSFIILFVFLYSVRVPVTFYLSPVSCSNFSPPSDGEYGVFLTIWCFPGKQSPYGLYWYTTNLAEHRKQPLYCNVKRISDDRVSVTVLWCLWFFCSFVFWLFTLVNICKIVLIMCNKKNLMTNSSWFRRRRPWIGVIRRRF